MLKEILGVVEKVNIRAVLITFLALSFTTFARDFNLIANPFTWWSLLIPAFVFMAYASVAGWVYVVSKLNLRLAENDIASWGPLLGCTILAFCVLVTFSYLSAHPTGISFSVLAEPNFVRLCTLYLLAVETIGIPRYA